ncbi:hypothetical protein ALC56_12884 [Trachymyrmex septentrionalis]|uniref:Uncharacterized protein n=1 Tax=Trachymyrmex septentrionalis TaxID=34720 RepID=A0A195EY58_9HYME|nr:hypothetical protein ALC56_12884 [Trachymyrmex septentrionalis]
MATYCARKISFPSAKAISKDNAPGDDEIEFTKTQSCDHDTIEVINDRQNNPFADSPRVEQYRAPVKQREFLRPHSQHAFRERLLCLPERTLPSCLPASTGQERARSLYSLFPPRLSAESAYGCWEFLSLGEIEEAFRSDLHEGEEGVLLNEDAIIRLHQRFLL